MAPLQDFFCSRKVLLLYLVFSFVLVSAHTQTQSLSYELLGRRRMLGVQKEDLPINKKTNTTTLSIKNKNKNQTKLIKPTTGLTKNQTTLIKTTTGSTKNQTKLMKTTTSSTKNQSKLMKTTTTGSTKNKTKLVKPITDSTPTVKTNLKRLNSTKPSSILTKKSSDLTKPTKPTITKQTQTQSNKKLSEEVKSPDKNQEATDKKTSKTKKKQTQPSWIDQEDEAGVDLVSGFTDLPFKFQETILPDLETLSTTSKVYLTKANKEITKGFKPIVGNKYAPTIASLVSCVFILIPLVLVFLIFTRIKAYFSIQKLLIFIQVYLSIYFSILCLSSLVTGLEPLRFFYSTSQSTYLCLQVLQSLGYVLYVLLLIMYLVLVFSTETRMGSKLVGLAQTFVGFSVGLHYYVTVFHKAVLHQPPNTSWRVHAIYATCFLVICMLANADRRKKAYMEEGGEEGKKS